MRRRGKSPGSTAAARLPLHGTPWVPATAGTGTSTVTRSGIAVQSRELVLFSTSVKGEKPAKYTGLREKSITLLGHMHSKVRLRKRLKAG